MDYTNKFSLLLGDYVKSFRESGEGFEDFSNEAILYSLLEYSKFPRPYTKKERIEYVYGKCLEYEGKPHVYVNVQFDEFNEDYFMIV